jgi:hypothetical protein
MKGVITSEDWSEFKSSIKYNFAEDNHFAELRDAEVLRERITTLNDIENYVGRYYSQEWIRKNVLQHSDDEIEEMNKQMQEEGVDEDQQDPQNDEQ